MFIKITDIILYINKFYFKINVNNIIKNSQKEINFENHK